MTKHLIAEVMSDRDGEVTLGALTLGTLASRVDAAINAGVPLDALVKHGYVPERLADGLYFEKPVDLADKDFDYLRDRASSVQPDVSNEAWAELRRRVEALGRVGEHGA